MHDLARLPAGSKVTVEFNDGIVRQFLIASIIWGVVGMLAGVFIALELSFWQVNLSLPGSPSAGCVRCTRTPPFSPSSAT